MGLIMLLWLAALPVFIVGFLFMIPFFLAMTPICMMISLMIQRRYWNGTAGAAEWLWGVFSKVPWYLWFERFDVDEFPAKSERALILSHPHGWMCVGALIGVHFNPKMPPTYFAVAPILFWIPVFGWCLYSLRCVPATKHHMIRSLKTSCVLLVVGGVPEIVCAERQRPTVFLKRRSGFARLAHESDCPLIGCWTDGELETYRRIQMPLFNLRRRLSFVYNLPIIFPYIFGWWGTWLPKPSPLHVRFMSPLYPTGSVEETKANYIAHLQSFGIKNLEVG